MKSSGFNVVNFWLDMYSLVSNRRIPQIRTKVSTQAKVTFNMHMSRIKAVYDLTNEDVKALIAYMYWHNPLGFENLAQYGKIENLQKSAPHYLKWKRSFGGVSNGSIGRSLIKDVIRSAKPRSDVDFELQKLMGDLFNSYTI